MLNSIAIIPARSGSQRIKSKNVKKFLGVPIISYSIEVAKKSGLFKKIIVSTDSNKIAKLATNLGAEVPFLRPKYLSDDFSTTADVIKYTIKNLDKDTLEYKYVCCISATAPFLRTKYLLDSFKIINKDKCNYVFGVTNFSYPIERSFKIKNNYPSMNFPKFYNSRSQDIKISYHDAGIFYWGKKTAWENKIKIFDKKTYCYRIKNLLVQDIDTIDDWNLALFKYRFINNKKKI